MIDYLWYIYMYALNTDLLKLIVMAVISLEVINHIIKVPSNHKSLSGASQYQEPSQIMGLLTRTNVLRSQVQLLQSLQPDREHADH